MMHFIITKQQKWQWHKHLIGLHGFGEFSESKKCVKTDFSDNSKVNNIKMVEPQWSSNILVK